ncbi:MAG TPA: DUF6089 family protein [Saprospiraceae bacterium]|nr:DUF6089 family protein [Saprospiraceae bacterium]
MKNLFIILLTVCSFSVSYAQPGWELGGTVGISTYLGDLNTSYRLEHPGFAARLFARYNFNPRICLKFVASYGHIAANDADSDNTFEHDRNLSFATHIFEGAGEFEFNFLPYKHGSKEEFFTPYMFLGFATYKFNPTAEYKGQTYNLNELGTEGQFLGAEYNLIQVAFTYGLGIKCDISYEWSINAEFSSRALFTDYLDDVSTVYPDVKNVRKLHGDVAAALVDRSVEIGFDPGIGQKDRQRGNSTDNDSYHMFTIGLAYYFGYIRCPSISNN